MGRIREMVSGIFPAWGPLSFSGLRSNFRIRGTTFFGPKPTFDDTIVDYNKARALYANQGSDFNLGAFFTKPIVDLQVDFIGLPVAATERETEDDFLNTCLHDFWANGLQQMLRNAIRDSKTVVRVQQDELEGDPLMSLGESLHCRLEIVDPERVSIERDPANMKLITRAVIKHEVEMVEDEGDFPRGVLPKVNTHDILEIITPDNFQYFDTTLQVELTEWNTGNAWGFVPLVEVENEYDSTMGGPQSDLETSYPLILAFHDCLTQSLQAHKYHSVPKVKLKLMDVQPFIRNNFPEALDEDGKIKPQTEISWKGKEILFLQSEEDADFLEARSVLGDSKELLNFLIDCISIASETPRWAFMILEAGSANQSNNAQTLPWAKKIIRKRQMFEKPMQELLKMVQKINNMTVVRPNLTWEIIRVEDQLAYNQALQMLVMGLEVAAQRQIISDSTYREILRKFIPNMKNPTQEAQDAKDNFDALPPAPEPAPSGNGTGSAKNIPVTTGQQGKNE